MRLSRNPPTRSFWVLLIFGVIGIFCGQRLFAENRLWKSNVGTEVEAQFISQTDTHVVLKNKAGAQLTVEKTKLSDNDQAFLQWLAADAKKQAAQPDKTAKPEPAVQPDKTAHSDPALEPSPANKAPPQPPAKDKSKTTPEKSRPEKPAQEEPAGKGALPGKHDSAAQTKPTRFEIPAVRFPYAIDFNKQRPIVDPPKTDYAKLARELCAPVPRPRFVQLVKAKLPLVNPERALLAQAGKFLLDHDEQREALTIWSIDTGKIVNTIKVGPLANPRCFTISASGKLVGIGRPDNTAAIYEVATGKLILEETMYARQGLKLLRLALNWDDDKHILLSSTGDIDRCLLKAPPAWHLNFAKEMELQGQAWAANNDEVGFVVSGRGRIVARASDRYSYTTYCQKNGAGCNATAPSVNIAIPAPNGFVFSASRELVRQGLKAPFLNDQGTVNPYKRAVDCLEIAQWSLDREDRYLWVTNKLGTQTVDIYDLEYFEVPVRVPVPQLPPGKYLHWHSSESRQLCYYNLETQELTAYELQQFEPPPQWKVIEAFHRGLIEMRFDRLDGLAEALKNELHPLPDGRQLPVLTEVLRSFYYHQFYVPYDEWVVRTQIWKQERRNSSLAKLVNAYIFVESAARLIDKRGPRKRGQGKIEPPTDQRTKTMLDAADKSLEPLLEAKTPYGDALYLQLRLAPLHGWGKEKLLEVAARMAQVAPEHSEFHHEMCKLLLSEELGEDGETELYAKTIADHFPEERGDILYGQLVHRLKDRFSQDDFLEFLKFDWARATRGLLAAAKKSPPDAAAICRAYDWHQFYQQSNRPNEFQSTEQDYEPVLAAFKKLQETQAWNIYTMPKEERWKAE